MNPVNLVYAENVIQRLRSNKARQCFTVVVVLDNLGYDKSVDVFWAGEDGQWTTLGAEYLGAAGEGREYWCARGVFALSRRRSLPGNIRFSVRYRVLDGEHWDNCEGRDYRIEADSGVLLGDVQLCNLDYRPQLAVGQDTSVLRIGVDAGLGAERVSVVWSDDDWRSRQRIECDLQCDAWDSLYRSNARNPNQYGVQLWQAQIAHKGAFRIRYRIECEVGGRLLVDANGGEDYHSSHRPLTLMILNLHCYQEDNQTAKLRQIARAMMEREVDVACLQEVAENWNQGQGDWQSNAARRINALLDSPMHVYYDWSHLGFDRYREGLAILSRYPLLHTEARYVSGDRDAFSIHSRKVLMAGLEVPSIGHINVFSVHLSWFEDGFAEQFEQLRHWAAERHGEQVDATLLCGDFNVTVGSPGYQLVVREGQYDDQFLHACNADAFAKIFRLPDPYWPALAQEDYRIDFVFMNREGRLQVTSAETLFTEHDNYGPVSDHCGYLLHFEPRPTAPEPGRPGRHPGDESLAEDTHFGQNHSDQNHPGENNSAVKTEADNDQRGALRNTPAG